MAYQNTPSTRPIDAVRLLVGDVSTSTSAELLSDNSYAYFIATTPNIYAAGSLAANSLGMLYAAEGTEKQVGDLKLSRDFDSEYWRTLAQRLDRMSAMQTSPYAGGISKADKKTQVANTDRVEPAFTRSQFDNPETIPPSDWRSST